MPCIRQSLKKTNLNPTKMQPGAPSPLPRIASHPSSRHGTGARRERIHFFHPDACKFQKVA
ncbi:hypothetical protein RSSE_p1536 (plasmid) [Ralstonia solanacearum]|nr:hypothetical protein RSSE_p1536 [Ralstonia solanacearum]